GKWWADLYHLARLRLQRAGVTAVYGGGFCTLREDQRFYSFRREKTAAGRMGHFIWMRSDTQDSQSFGELGGGRV
ncbi:MAG: hypothetical protein G3H99_06405, partial [Ferrovum sp.]|nr:hypothetical protein [Ferrovum sp.]